MALVTCSLHKLTYNDQLDPTCPQCTLAGITGARQLIATPGKHGAPALAPGQDLAPGTDVTEID